MELTDDVKFVKGVGPNRVKLLNKLNIYKLEDLITYYPREYEDRSKPKKIADTENGEECLIEGIVTSHIKEIRTHRKNMIIYKLIVRDDTDSCELVWYNQSYLKKMFRIGETYKFFGRINKRIGQTEMVSPVYDLEGNTSEWTTLGGSLWYRDVRGGNWTSAAKSAAGRRGWEAWYGHPSRIILYVNK